MSAREVLIRRATRQLCRWRRLHSLQVRLGDSDGNGSDSVVGFGGDVEDGGGTSQVGEGSVVPEERSSEVLDMCDNDGTLLESGSIEEKKNDEESRVEGQSFFDCNICLDLSREPVVTCCGHLFCWSCIYQWLNIHSNAKECPVCKGEVTLKNVTPIYGRGGSHTLDLEEDSGIKIPARPSSRRVESVRQTIRRTAEMSSSLFPIEEIIRLIISDGSDDRDSNSNSRASILNRILTTRARQREQALAIPQNDMVDLGLTGTPIIPDGSDDRDSNSNSRASILNRILTARARHREQASAIPLDDMVDLGLTGASIIPDGSDDRDSNSNSRASILNRILTTRVRQREQASSIPLDDMVDLGLTGASMSSIPNRIITTRARQREQASVIPQEDIVELAPARISIPNITMTSNDVVDLTRDEPMEIPRSLPPLIYRREWSPWSSSNDDRDSIRRMAAVILEESQTVDTGVESDSLVSLSTSSSRRSDVDSGNPRALRRRRLN